VAITLAVVDDHTHELFQFLWIAFMRTQLRPTMYRQALAASLLGKMSLLTQETPEGGRVPIRECELELTADEQALCLDMIQTVPWDEVARANRAEVGEVIGRVKNLCRWLGTEVRV
jgi:hypothetical protein